jgi:peptide-methionine (R)-S-oxide reductase
MENVRLTDDEWRQRLTPEEYRVLRQAGTEAPFTGEYTDTKTEGVYRCRACGAELFRSAAKFDSHCGWPSFYQPTEDDAVVLLEDRSLGSVRTEVRCANCGSHLGHVFEGEGYQVPTDQRWCINSVSLTLEPAAGGAGTGGGPPGPPGKRSWSTSAAADRQSALAGRCLWRRLELELGNVRGRRAVVVAAAGRRARRIRVWPSLARADPAGPQPAGTQSAARGSGQQQEADRAREDQDDSDVVHVQFARGAHGEGKP